MKVCASTGRTHKCLSHCSIAVKRQHDHGSSYKGKHLIGACLQVQGFSPLSSQWKTWWHTGRHDAGEGVENSTSGLTGNRKTERDNGPGLNI